MKRMFFFGFGCIAYGMFCFSFLFAFLFLGKFTGYEDAVNRPEMETTKALFINLILLIFPVMFYQLMLKDRFRDLWKRNIPQPLRRSSFVFLWSACILMVCSCWEPMERPIWDIKKGFLHDLLTILFIGGWMLSLLSTFLINHFDFFGIRQVWLYYKGEKYEAPRFKTPMVLQLAHHPMRLGLFIGFWATPYMTLSHLLIAMLVTIFLVNAIQSKEKKQREFEGSIESKQKYHADLLSRS